MTDELGAVKFSEEGLTLASLIGQTPQFTIYSHVQYERVVKDILRKITKGLQDRTEPLLHAAPITLTEIIGQTPRLAIYSRSQYERLVYNVFHKLKSQVSDKTSLTSEPIKLRDLIGSTPQFTFWTNRSYQQLIRKVLGKIGENISKITVANKNFDLASLIGKTPEFGFWAKLKFQSIIWKVLGSVESGLKGQGMSLSFDLSKLFIGEELSTNSKKRFKTAINKLISKIDGASVVDLNLASLLGGQPKQNRPGGFQSDLNQENDVVVADFLPGALGKLKHFFGVPSHDSATLAGIHHVKGESNTSWIGKIAAALLAALVASGISIYLAINGMLDNGPLKGLKKLGYQVAHWASKFFYSLAKKVFQFGMKFKGLGGLAKSIITKIESPFKKIGTFLTEHVGGAFRSFFGKIGSSIGKVLKGFLPSLFGSTSAIATKILPKLGSGVFGGISKWLGKFFTKKAATKIPFGIGTVIGLGFAFSRFKDGDWIGGLLDTASAIASAYPGVGTAIAIAIDVFSAARDLKTGGSEAVGKANGNGNLMGKLWGWLKTKWPLAGWILAGEGIKEIFGGNFRSGFTKLDAGLLNTSFGWILDIFGVDQNKTASIIDNSASTVGDFFGSVVNWISSSAPIKWMGKVSSGLFKLLGLDVKSGLQDLDAAGIPFMGSILSFFNNIPNIPDMMNNAVDTTYDFFTGLASTISNKIHDFISSAINWVTDHIPGFNLIKSGWGWLTGSSNNKPEARPTNLSRPNIKAIEKPEVPIITAKVDSTAMAEIKKGLDDHTKEMASMSLFIQQLLSEFKNAGKDIGIIADNSKIRPTNNSQANQSSMKPPLDTATVRDHIFEKRREYRSA